jgi:hypothetical protein
MEAMAFTSVDGGPSMVHKVVEAVAPGKLSRAVITGVGSAAPPVLIESRSPYVSSFLIRKQEALLETARRNRPMQPIFKERSTKEKRKSPIVECPSCSGEAWDSCGLCRGNGVVAVDKAEAWRIDRYGH